AGDAGPGPCLALAVIALVAAFLATAGPREITSLQNKALRQTLAQAGGFGISAASSWQVSGFPERTSPTGPTVTGFETVTAAQIQAMSGAMAGFIGPPLV